MPRTTSPAFAFTGEGWPYFAPCASIDGVPHVLAKPAAVRIWRRLSTAIQRNFDDVIGWDSEASADRDALAYLDDPVEAS